MPLFASKFSTKKAPQRKNPPTAVIEEQQQLEPLATEDRTVRVKLGEQECIFRNGNWMPERGENSGIYSSNEKLRRKVNELQEENNLLRLKYEVLLNMLTQTTAESHLQQREIDKLHKMKTTK